MNRERAKRVVARLPERHIVLIGMMGVGKTTVGRDLAERLGREFWDNDVALANATGMTAAEVLQTDGEAALHALEDQLLRSALGRPEPMVIAAAASVVLGTDAIAGALTVWLRASADRELENISASGQHHRPLHGDTAAMLRHVSAARAPLYARLADIIVDVTVDPVSTCDRLLKTLEESGQRC